MKVDAEDGENGPMSLESRGSMISSRNTAFNNANNECTFSNEKINEMKQSPIKTNLGNRQSKPLNRN